MYSDNGTEVSAAVDYSGPRGEKSLWEFQSPFVNGFHKKFTTTDVMWIFNQDLPQHRLYPIKELKDMILAATRFCDSYAKQPSRNKTSLETTSITEPVWTRKYVTKFIVAQDIRLKAITEVVTNMNVKLYDTSTVFTFLATVRIVEEPIRLLPDVSGIFIESKFVLTRIVKFLAEPELPKRSTEGQCKYIELSILIKEATFSWHVSSSHATLENIDLNVKPGKKIAICGEVGSGKLTLLAEILGEVSSTQGTVQVYGKVAYVSQNRMDTNRNYVREYTLRVINGSREVPKSTEKVFTCTRSENSSMW
ncbi:hypothetical protein POM88_037483 [Heracleum sosnowskyi]|uniref:ABC transporter domain-containing protein n=1 Tax=Heracleum sosnowskyi TaxID=360622 RepID=A0AAD8HQF7_9APIA|nr:hypothetical protein POM88_037483 [Heracleum sosnowskyi]